MSAAGRVAVALLGMGWVAACGPANPCASARARLARRRAAPYAGHWVVAHGDTVTFPEMGDRFRLTDVVLDTAGVPVAQACRWRGSLIFTAPRAETLMVTWAAEPDQAFVYGWPAALGPFGGLGVARAGDSLRGSLLFDSRLGVQVRPGVTAQFVAARARDR